MKKKLLSILTLFTMTVSLFSPVVLAQEEIKNEIEKTEIIEEVMKEEKEDDEEITEKITVAPSEDEGGETKTEDEVNKVGENIEESIELEDLTIHDKDGNEIKEDEELILKDDEKVELKAEGLADKNYQWQIANPKSTEENDEWIDIQDETEETLKIDYALVKNVLVEDATEIRVRSAEDQEHFSEAIKVKFVLKEMNEVKDKDEEKESVSYTSFSSQDDSSQDETSTDKFTVRIEYQIGGSATDKPIEDPYIAELNNEELMDNPFIKTVKSPEIIGYRPDRVEIGTDGVEPSDIFEFDGDFKPKEAREIHFNIEQLSRDVTIRVIYEPDNVGFTVRHHHQNIDDDKYTLVEKESKDGSTGNLVNGALNDEEKSLAKEIEGFYSLNYPNEEISADGKTVIDIYYDREYYLMFFDLDGGFGIEPIYAKFGAPIKIDQEKLQRPGYKFDGWQEDIPKTMPAEYTSYKATWKPVETTFTIQYMLQDPNEEDKYNYWGHRVEKKKTGDQVDVKDYKNVNDMTQLDEDERYYSEYSHADQNVEIKGDGTTVVNVYFNRKEYTLKFYYAIEEKKSGSSEFSVIGGSTYFFGKDAQISDKSNPIKLLDQYVEVRGRPSAQRGIVKEKPDLKESIKNSGKYKTGSDQSTEKSKFHYHYLSFKAKYGADISEKWPIDVFKSVKRTETEIASFSAWNGEHNVKYTQDEKNQTIKGKYAKLDEKLLWDKEKFEDSQEKEVAYLGYWLNGAPKKDVPWSIPKLFRYHIQLPIIGDKDEYETEIYNTVDDSKPDQQTYPNLVGFTKATDKPSYKKINRPDLDEKYVDGHNMYFKYTRNSYDLTFKNSGEDVKTESMQYEESFSKYEDYQPPYPKNLEANAYEFAGWSKSPVIEEDTPLADLNKLKMPANAMTLYAKWTEKEHDVKFYNSLSEINTGKPLGLYKVLHNQKIKLEEDEELPEPNPEDDSFKFIGWFYLENGVEKAFDPEKMPVTKPLNLYPKWRSDKIVDYEVNYILIDENNEAIHVAHPLSRQALAGSSKTFEPVYGDALYGEYQEGFYPDAPSKALELKLEGPNILKFYYKEAEEVEYSVRYLDSQNQPLIKVDSTGRLFYLDVKGKYYSYKENGEKEYAESNSNLEEYQKEEKTRKNVITEEFEWITGYLPDSFYKRKVLTSDKEKNKIVFYYEQSAEKVPAIIKHFKQNTDGEGYTEVESDRKEEIREYDPQNPGIVNLSNKRENYDGYKFSKVTSFNDEPLDINKDVQITERGLELNYYYDRDTVNLTISKEIHGDTQYSDKDKFLFKIIGKDNDIDMMVTVSGNEEVTITDLPAGEYTITEDIAWSWRYECLGYNSISKEITSDATIKFENEFSKNKWLSDEQSKENIFKPRGGE